LDEAPEFKVNVLQALREPLEDRNITIVRAEGPVKLPADFQLLLAANPCPCGKLGSRREQGGSRQAEAACSCSATEISRYWRKVGGALLDRIEIRVPVFSSNADEMVAPSASCAPGATGAPEETSAVIAARVSQAVAVQRLRFAGTPVRRNAAMGPALIEKHCALSGSAQTAFFAAIEKLKFSGRALHGVLRLARTIADLDGKDTITALHILEAVQHRRYGDDPFDILEVYK
jgi:magnesium chelatase family protein